MGTNTGLGIGIGIPFKNNALGGDRPYLPPELKARLIGVWDNYGKKNTDADRNIIKNKIPNAGGDLEILNAAYKLNSGFGEYKEDFTSWRIYPNIEVTDNVITTNGNFNSTWFIYKHSSESKINEMNIKVSGIPKGGKILYFYISDETANLPIAYTIPKDGIYHLPESKINNNRASVGFTVESSYDWNNIRIEQIPSFEGAFVTDGIDDLITSTKTVQEMLGGSNEITVVSMVHQIKDTANNVSFTNYIRGSANGYFRNIVNNYGKTGIYGYTSSDLRSLSVINNILGDKNDYTSNGDNRDSIINGNFSVQGYSYNDGNNTGDFSSVAWYWTIIANKVLTTDQINQVIAYFNLDKTLKPDMLCNITKQGITNDNHADFNDKLIDYSGNGRDIQMNNLAWKGGSGIAAKPFETIKDYTIVSDEARQKLTIYNEFSYKIKSNTPSYYWTVQSIIRDNTSYQVTIITDKDCYWINATSFINSEGNKESIRKKYPVLANTPTQVIICGLDQFEYPEGIEPTSAVSYVNLEYAGEITVTFIPSYKGGILLDGINDFGQFVGDLGLKDYTFIADRAYDRIVLEQAPFIASTQTNGQAPFLMEYLNEDTYVYPHSFGTTTKTTNLNIQRQISYQSTYVYNGNSISKGTSVDTGDGLTIGNSGSTGAQYSPLCLWSLMLFPYSMSEFLIERQLKKHKLGTLYPNMVEFRPVIKSNTSYDNIVFYYKNEKVENGTYLTVGSSIGMHIRLSSSPVNEIKSITVNGIPATFKFHDANNIYQYDFNLTSKSPQKIDITIDEYIRYEEIVQPYPVIFQITDRNTNQRYSWGDKIKVGSSIRLSQGEKPNLLSGLYSIQSYEYEGETYSYNQLTNLNIILTKQSISLSCNKTWLLDDNEPKCILSPRLLRIPNSSYKILGYIPDISGHGNHGVIHNSAYAEGSGVNEDGSYQFDGVDDFVTIPTTVGGKQVLMKVNWNTINSIIYDQRTNGGFAIFNSDFDTNENKVPAYRARNIGGSTYIDGILNKYIYASELKNITHNIVELHDPKLNTGTLNPKIGSSFLNSNYTQMSLYDFMLFDEISTDDKIEELNKYIGIEAKVELPPYYWDTYGKTNSDADRDTIQQRGIAVGDYDLTNYNHVYEGMSGYNGYPVVFGANKTWEILSSAYGYISDVTSTTIHVTMVKNAGTGLLFSYVKKDEALTNIKEIPAFRVTIKGLEGNSKFGYRYLATEDATGETLVYLGNGTHELAKSFAPTKALLDLTRNAWVGIFITPMVEGEVVFDCDITIEVLPEYENGLAYDGVEDYSKNVNIPALTEYTYIYKRTIINVPTNAATLLKGADKTNGGAFIADYGNKWQFNFGQYNIIQGIADGINWQTVNSFNGTSINKGENTDDSGITVAKFSNGYTSMVFYKLILYPKTIPLLQINFLKNLMEKDEIIDLNNPIFIKNE